MYKEMKGVEKGPAVLNAARPITLLCPLSALLLKKNMGRPENFSP
jgi:hypothetical protein